MRNEIKSKMQTCLITASSKIWLTQVKNQIETQQWFYR